MIGPPLSLVGGVAFNAFTRRVKGLLGPACLVTPAARSRKRSLPLDMRQMARSYTAEALDKLVQLMRGEVKVRDKVHPVLVHTQSR